MHSPFRLPSSQIDKYIASFYFYSNTPSPSSTGAQFLPVFPTSRDIIDRLLTFTLSYTSLSGNFSHLLFQDKSYRNIIQLGPFYALPSISVSRLGFRRSVTITLSHPISSTRSFSVMYNCTMFTTLLSIISHLSASISIRTNSTVARYAS